MKKLVLLINMLILASALYAQAPQAINYQAVARDAAGNLIANQDISFRLSILQGGPAGTVIYSESHLETSNQFGLVTMEIGRGTVISGVFANILWGNGSYWVKTEMDPTGGTSYQEMGTSEFLSVPHALYAPFSAHNTLDKAYDQGGPGAGRAITADAGDVIIYVPVGITNNGLTSLMAGGGDAGDFQCTGVTNAVRGWAQGNGIAGNFRADGVGNAIFAQATNGAAAYTGVFLAQGATIPINAEAENGYGGRFVGGVLGLSNGINDAGHFVNSTVGARAIFGEITDAANASNAIVGITAGEGHAIRGWITKPTNSTSSIFGQTDGIGDAVRGTINNVLSTGAGVRGSSNATAVTVSSGVRAVGNGAAENAAALTLDNGAVRVAGVCRPAGKVPIAGVWNEIVSSIDLIGIHDHRHVIGHYVNDDIINDLITEDSYIQLTVEANSDTLSCFPQILSIEDGVAHIRVTSVGAGVVAVAKWVHYWIVNPEPVIP